MNASRIFFILALMAATLAIPAYAEVTEGLTVEFSPEVYYYRYEEPSVMENEGIFYGVLGVMEARTGTSSIVDFGRVEGRVAIGQVDYTSVNTGSTDNIDDWVIELRGLAGKDLIREGDTLVSVYTGLGYRYLNDDSAGMRSTTGHYGYERESNYLYLPIGLEFSTPMTTSWTFGANAEFDVFLRGEQKSHLSDVGPGYLDPENTQTEGYGARGSLSFVREGASVDVSIEPFIRWWDIKDSELATAGVFGSAVLIGLEPENTTTEAGVQVGMSF